ncbi:MAG: hypothetical protein ACE5LU_02565 [Anaerolineae bacterium]
MARDTAFEQPARTDDTMTQPYPPSWVNRFTGWVNRLPVPSWLPYLGLWLVSFLLLNGLKWLDRSQALGTIGIRHGARVLHPIYFLAMMHYLNVAAGAALRTFRPVLTVSEAEYKRLHYRLTTLPAQGALLASGIGAALAGLTILIDPTPLNPEYATSRPMALFDAAIFVVSLAILGILIYHTIHQFTTVNRIHAAATHIDLFHPDPLYAFSGLTARTVVGYILIADFTYMFLREEATHPATIGVFATMVLLAVAVFVLPLLGMHRRMLEEKERLRDETSRRMKAAIAELHRRVDTGDFDNMTELFRTMTSLEIERDVWLRIPTWPWEPGTVRGLISALLLPVMVWLIQRVLDSLLGS